MKQLISLLAIMVALAAVAQSSSHQYITVVAEPDHADWTYKTGQQAEITAYAIKENVRMTGVEITYSYGPEKHDAVKTGTVKTDKNGIARFKVPGMKQPGFTSVRVKVNYEGHDYSSMTNIAFDPFKLKPTTEMPKDFNEFWDNAMKKAEQVPMEVVSRHSDEESTASIDVYYVRIQSYRKGNYVYGVLSVPKSPGRKAAILRLPGAAVRRFNGPSDLASEGFVVLEIGVHGIPVDQDPEIYRQLETGALAGYTSQGIDNRDSYYYKRSILGCVRAIDYLCSLDCVDSKRIATYGGSQGGMLSIMTASLDRRVKCLFAYFPAFCELTGYYNGRAGGWPHMFRNADEPNLQARIEVSRYYDTVNFARRLKAPGIYAWGFNDPACCPTSTFSAYNVMEAPKQLHLGRDTGHWLYPWQLEKAMEFLKQQLNVK